MALNFPSPEFENLYREVQIVQSVWGLDRTLLALAILELRQLNKNLQELDLSLQAREMR